MLERNLSCAFGYHNWSYSEIKKQATQLVDHWKCQLVPNSEGISLYQIRTCSKCGLAQKKDVTEY